jgi:pyruvate kinase
MCLTPNPTAARQASGLLQGVHTVVVDNLHNCVELLEDISYELVQSGSLKVGDIIIAIAGRMASMKEQLQCLTLTEGKSHGHIISGGTQFFYSRKFLLHYNEGSPVRSIRKMGA